MRLVSTINLKLGFLFLTGPIIAFSQENSPFSRYGLGNLFAGQHIINRGMAGLSTPYVDAQSINFYNPASYSGLKVVTFDVGIAISNQTLRSANPTAKYSSTNFTPSYLAFGVPINKKKEIGMVFGLRPISKINYSLQENKRVPGIDSMATLYEGTGGLNQLFIGFGKRWKTFSLGFNTGYAFGSKETNTRVFINNTDTSSFIPYTSSNSGTITSYGQFFLDAGLQYQIKVSKSSSVRLGFNADLKQKLKASQDLVRETFVYDNAGTSARVDSVFENKDRKGTIEMPATYTAGILFQQSVQDKLGNKTDKASIGIEYETSQWSKFRFYDQPDKLINSWQVRIGGQFTPDPLSVTRYGSRITYRAGFNYGKDQINADANELSTYGLTFGAGLPVRKWRSLDNQFTVLNLALEYGKRGSGKNNITENYFRIAFGVSLSDIWFVKNKYY